MMKPSRLGWDLFLRAGLHQGNMAAHYGIVFAEDLAWKNGVGTSPLRGLRTRAIPRVLLQTILRASTWAGNEIRAGRQPSLGLPLGLRREVNRP